MREAASRKHHLVPSFYLRGWERAGLLRVTDLDDQRSFLTSASKAIRETDFYSLESEDLDPEEVPPLLAEDTLSTIESDAADSIRALLNHSGAIPQHHRSSLAMLMAMQLTRGRINRESLSNFVHQTSHALVRGAPTDQLRGALWRILDREPTEAEIIDARHSLQVQGLDAVGWYPHQASMVAQSMDLGANYAHDLQRREWVFLDSPSFPFLTTDEPVVPIGFETESRYRRPGLDVAPVVFFPLSPRTMLAMFHPAVDRVRHVDDGGRLTVSFDQTLALNHELLANSHRWAIEVPVDARRSLALRMHVPPRPTPFVSIWPSDTVDDARHQIVAGVTVPTRWPMFGEPPSPVRGWFHSPPAVPQAVAALRGAPPLRGLSG